MQDTQEDPKQAGSSGHRCIHIHRRIDPPDTIYTHTQDDPVQDPPDTGADPMKDTSQGDLGSSGHNRYRWIDLRVTWDPPDTTDIDG